MAKPDYDFSQLIQFFTYITANLSPGGRLRAKVQRN